MSREAFAYRDILESILDFSGGAHVLNIAAVRRFCYGDGKPNYNTVKKKFPFRADNTISAEALARSLSGRG